MRDRQGHKLTLSDLTHGMYIDSHWRFITGEEFFGCPFELHEEYCFCESEILVLAPCWLSDYLLWIELCSLKIHVLTP